MRYINRLILALYALFTIIVSGVLLLSLLNTAAGTFFLNIFTDIQNDYVSLILSTAFLLSVIILAIMSVVNNILRMGRLGNTRLSSNELGSIEIDVNALENISLNSAKLSEAGIKTAKAKVYANQDKGINVELIVSLYSDIEIPSQMLKIQERIKKDIERFTGIPVTKVIVRVAKVELLGTKVER